MELIYEQIFRPSLMVMKFNRSDPSIKRDLKWLIRFIPFHGFYTLIFALIIHNIIFLNLKANDFSQTCKNGTFSVVYLVNSFHYFILVWKQDHLAGLRESMKNDYASVKFLPVKEQNIIREFAMKGGFVSKLWLVVCTIGASLFVVKNIVLIIFYTIKGEFRLVPLYEFVYPSFIEDHNDSVAFALTYILILYFGFYSSTLYTAFVPLGPILMLHACGQLEVVKLRTEDLFKSNNIEEVRLKLKDIVKHLQYIYDFVERIKLCFRIAYEMTLKATILILPITCYEVVESLKHGEVSLEFITFIIGGILISGSPCYYSELLMEKGEDLRLAMYFCGWESVYDRGIRRTISLVLQRALRPVAIDSLFRPVCLVALSDVFQQAYTIFNLMNAMWN